MLRYLNIIPKRKPAEQQLPDPSSFDDPKTVVAVNSVVQKSLNRSSGPKKRGAYSKYDDEFRSKVARYARENGITAASQKFSKQIQKLLPEQTIRNWRDQVIKEESRTNSSIDSIQLKKRGRPLLLGPDLDEKVRLHHLYQKQASQ